jgi:phospholipase A1
MKNSRIKMCYIKGKSLTRFILCLLIFSSITKASNNNLDICLAEKARSENQDLTLGELNRICNKVVADDEKNQPAVEKRFNSERRLAYHPFVITPHHMNYLLPVTYTDKINQSAYDDKGNWPQNLDNMEAKLQISFKVPLLTESLFNEGDAIAFGFTLQSWWQMYNQELSRPFRETNYNPELFYFTPLDFEIGGGKTGFFLGLEHQSNGQSLQLSRSWNRIYANFIFAKGNYALSFRPWWKIPEGDKLTTPEEAGNDNPDISDYMGHFELMMVYKWENHEFSVKGRENFATHNGAVEVGITFPLNGKLRGYFQYFSGYGESLIDYNHSQERFGLGIALNDYF